MGAGAIAAAVVSGVVLGLCYWGVMALVRFLRRRAGKPD